MRAVYRVLPARGLRVALYIHRSIATGVANVRSLSEEAGGTALARLLGLFFAQIVRPARKRSPPTLPSVSTPSSLHSSPRVRRISGEQRKHRTAGCRFHE